VISIGIFSRSTRSPTKEKMRCVYMPDIGDLPTGYVNLSTNEEINRCVYKIADLVSNMTIMLMENGQNGDIRIKDELSRKIDVNPNSNMTRKTFIHTIVAEMLISGNCTVYPNIDKNGYISDLQIMNNCSYISKGNGYEIRHNGIVYNSNDVLHFVLNPILKYPWKGCGVYPLLRQTIENLAQANNTKNGFLKSKWKPALIITVETDVEELIDKDKRDKIIDSYTDTTEAGEPWLIPAGQVDVKTVQPLTLKDLAIQDSITLDLRTVASAIGLPPFLIGVGDFEINSYNNFINTTIMSIATIIQQEFTRKLLISPTRYFRFNPKSLLQYNLSEKMEFVKSMVDGGMINRNEGRNEFDYSPVDEDGMNDYIVLENYIPISKSGDQNKLAKGMISNQ
jgi:HK97 family phage portal protein